jgi:hypothetical protein
MLKIIISISVTILSLTAITAQNVGYMGRKISVETALNATPSVFNILNKSPGKSKYYVAPNFGILFTTSSSTEIGIKVGFENVKPILLSDYYYREDGSYTDYSFEPDSRNARLNYKTFDFVIRNYTNSGYIAPIGTYFQYLFGVSSKITSDSIEGELFYTNNWDNLPAFTFDYGTMSSSVGSRIFRLGIGLGRKAIITDGLFYQIELNVMYNHLYLKDSEDDSYGSVSEHILQNSYYDRRYIRWDKLVEFKIGLGYMF